LGFELDPVVVVCTIITSPDPDLDPDCATLQFVFFWDCHIENDRKSDKGGYAIEAVIRQRS
jgi:hypothetical protein